jgi:hypothetical protein
MDLIESLPRFLYPTRRRGLRWLRERLRDLGVTAPLSPGCLNELLTGAAQAAALESRSGENYGASLRKQLDARARFVHLWTTTDATLTQPEWTEWIALARRHLLPRSWTISEPGVTESQRDQSFAVPERLIVKGPQPGDSGAELPGTEILSDLKRANDKS